MRRGCVPHDHRQVAAGIAAEHGLPGGLVRRRIERRGALAGGPFKPVGELPGVVGDQPGRVPGPRDRYAERALIDQVGVLRRHLFEDPVHCPALKGMHHRREASVDVPEPGVALSEFRNIAVVKAEDHTLAADRFHRRSPLASPEAGSLRVKRTRSPRRSSIASLR